MNFKKKVADFCWTMLEENSPKYSKTINHSQKGDVLNRVGFVRLLDCWVTLKQLNLPKVGAAPELPRHQHWNVMTLIALSLLKAWKEENPGLPATGPTAFPLAMVLFSNPL